MNISNQRCTQHTLNNVQMCTSSVQHHTSEHWTLTDCKNLLKGWTNKVSIATYRMNLGHPVAVWFSFSICVNRELLKATGIGFYKSDALPGHPTVSKQCKKTIRKHLRTEVSHDIRNPKMQFSYFKAVCITRRHLSLMLVIGSAHKICREESMHPSVCPSMATNFAAGRRYRSNAAWCTAARGVKMGRVYIVAEHRFVSNTYLGYKAPWYCQTLNLAS